ncbi:MAG: hypothetical protein CMN56_01205 [Sneathiella sp.]|nr:hypothetical protein [Sneathiella sp.]
MEEVRAQAQPSHGPWLSPEAKAKGLVLTEDGAAGPRNEKKRNSALQGCQMMRKGSKPNGRDSLLARFTRARSSGMRQFT